MFGHDYVNDLMLASISICVISIACCANIAMFDFYEDLESDDIETFFWTWLAIILKYIYI